MRLIYSNNAVLTSLSPLNVGVFVDGTPSGSVDIQITGDEIITITQTITAQQAQDGYCFSVYADNANGGRKPFTIMVSATGGVTESKQFTAYLSEETEEVSSRWTPYLSCFDGYANWRNEYPTFTLSGLQAKIDDLKNDLFKGSYPSGAPLSVSDVSDGFGIVFDNANNSSFKKRITVREVDIDGYNWDCIVNWTKNTADATTLVWDCFGHGEPGHDDLYNAIMNNGYDYASSEMGGDNNTSNPAISGTFLGHNSYLSGGLDREGYDARRLFFFHKIRALDYILTQKSYTKIVVVGISGGGGLAGMWAAFDTRIHKTFICRGTNANGLMENDPHYEEAPTTRFDPLNENLCGPRVAESLRKHPRLQQIAMACANGREVYQLAHSNDTTANFRGWFPDVYYYDLKGYCETTLNGVYRQYTNTISGESTHGYQASDIDYIMDNI